MLWFFYSTAVSVFEPCLPSAVCVPRLAYFGSIDYAYGRRSRSGLSVNAGLPGAGMCALVAYVDEAS